MQVYYDRDADLNVLKGKKVAVLGYGSQGHAHANNLRDSGVDVVVGLRRGSSSWAKAENAGLKLAETAEAAAMADIVMVLLPDELQGDAYEKEIRPGLKSGNYLGFGHGFNIHFKRIVPPAGVNVFTVAPKGPGHLVRSEYEKGRGVPCLLAVHQDPSGDTTKIGLAYASAIGSRIVFNPLPQNDPKVRQPDITKAKRILGWEPRVSRGEGLRRTLQYFKGKITASQR